METLLMNEMIARASADQAKASDPAASVFVSANAGTGKTKLLTDRVLRLLLSGAPADGILCVTYTRAAAAEMRNRIFKRLANWATIPAKALGEIWKIWALSCQVRICVVGQEAYLPKFWIMMMGRVSRLCILFVSQFCGAFQLRRVSPCMCSLLMMMNKVG